jgi:hypothetical protein
VITQDGVLGQHLLEMTALIRSRPLLLIVLAPQTHTVAARGKTAYDTWAVDQLDEVLSHQTPRLGLWLDTTGQTPADTVDEILTRSWTKARISGSVT